LKLKRSYLPDIGRYEEVSNELHRFKVECENRIRELVDKLRDQKRRFEDSEAKVALAERQLILESTRQHQSQPPSRRLKKTSSRILSNLMTSQDRSRRAVKFEADSQLQEVTDANLRPQTTRK
jgi:predicted nuclease with TOPRIM domain